MGDKLVVSGNEIERMIKQANLADSTKIKYLSAIRGYLATGNSLADAEALTSYAQTLSKSGKAFLKSAIRLWSNEIARRAKAGATPDNVKAVQATVYRVEALQDAIKVKADNGTKAHTWLSQAEVKRLLQNCCDMDTITGLRDKITLGLLTGAGLRREELVNLTWADIERLPVKGKMRTVLNIKGKGAKNRPVPISDKLAAALDKWADVVGREGFVVRSLGMNRELGDSISAVAIFHLVNKDGAKIGKPDLAPHDLRRTYAQLGYEAGVPITQISKLLGHSSVATTQRYLNLDLDLETAVSDFIPFE
jgi:site-specific recombinase XerD